MPIIITNCKTCTATIKIGREARKLCSVCAMCYEDVTKTRTRVEAELSDVDLSKCTKLYFKNYVCYSEEECKPFDKGLTLKDIIILKHSPRFAGVPHDERHAIITLFCDRLNFDHEKVYKDKDVETFVTHGLINYATDSKFFQALMDKFKQFKP